jgi:hypothetical protein
MVAITIPVLRPGTRGRLLYDLQLLLQCALQLAELNLGDGCRTGHAMMIMDLVAIDYAVSFLYS